MTRNEGSIRGVKDVNLEPFTESQRSQYMAVAKRTVTTKEGSTRVHAMILKRFPRFGSIT